MSDRKPICDHVAEVTVSVQSHFDQAEADQRGERFAGTRTCGRNECVLDAQRWVQEMTGLPNGLVRSLRRTGRRP